MAHSSLSSKYTRLDTARSEIRVLTLFPSLDESAPVKCSLEVVSLDDTERPAFEALSYAWHDPRLKPEDARPVQVHINESEAVFHPTPNLHVALQHLRQAQETRTLWIDALCINQDDVDEKNHQVPLMARIYRDAATSVVCWLGPSTNDVAVLLAHHPDTEFDQLEDLYPLSGMEEPPLPSSSSTASLTKKIRVFAALLRAWVYIFDNPWWTRMWTFQEYTLPVNVPVLCCGRMPVSLQLVGYLESSTRILRYTRLMNEQVLQEPVEHQKALRERDISEIYRLGRRLQGYGDIATRVASYTHGDWRFLAKLLYFTIGRECSIPCDRFYALYGLASGLQASLPISYEKSFLQVSKDVATYVLVKEGGALLFDYWKYPTISLDRSSSSCNTPSQPSWVPDFRQPSNDLVKPRAKMTDDQPWPTVSHSQDVSTLYIHGVPHGGLSVITRFGATLPEIALQLVGGILDVLGSCSSQSAMHSCDVGDIARALLPLVVRKATIMKLPEAVDLGGEFLSALCHLSYRQLDATVSSQSGIMGGVLAREDQGGLGILAGKVLFTTSDGYLGIGYSNIRNGDLVVRLSGQRTCSVLRLEGPPNSSAPTSSETFVMVGPATTSRYIERNDGLADISKLFTIH